LRRAATAITLDDVGSPPPDTSAWAAEVRRQAQKQWSHNPAGEVAIGDAALGTPDSFARVEAHRYREQPWMHETFEFERYAGKSVLEVGVGLGTDHAQFARAGARMTGVDLTPRCIELTKARFAQEGLESNLLVMDAERLEFEDASFDAVFSFGVLHHVADPDRALAEIRRVLRPGGTFAGAWYNKHSAFYARILAERLIRGDARAESIGDRLSRVEHSTTDAKPLVRLLTSRELRSMLARAGFSEIKIARRHLGLGGGRVPALAERLTGRVAGWYLIHHAR
jgi:ubiquinone/menaquinone biosynthesis C-methylase UbiE